MELAAGIVILVIGLTVIIFHRPFFDFARRVALAVTGKEWEYLYDRRHGPWLVLVVGLGFAGFGCLLIVNSLTS